MAITEIIEITDDMDGSPDAEGVTFSLNGVDYAIDLAPLNRAGLEEALAPFIAVAHRLDRTPRRKERKRAKGERPGNAAAIRTWAAEQGIQVADRGRIPTEVKLAFESA